MSTKYALVFGPNDTPVVNGIYATKEIAETFLADRRANGHAFEGEHVKHVTPSLDDLTTELRTLLASFREWETRLTKSAYRKGVDAGLTGTKPWDELHECPYRCQGNNRWRGGNDPRAAWTEGVRDGVRILALLAEPSKVFPAITWREAKIIGYDQ